jgi:protein ImuB
VILLDRGITRLRGIEPTVIERVELSMPLWRDHELLRIVSSRLERLELGAPSVGLALRVPSITEATGRQLDLSRVCGGVNGYRGLDELPILLSELKADIGKHNVGLLTVEDDHRPEAKSRLASAVPNGEPGARASVRKPSKAVGPRKAHPREAHSRKAHSRKAMEPSGGPTRAPTRLLPVPVPIEAPLKVGSTLCIGKELYRIEKLDFEHRLDAVEWWLTPVGRDYSRLWLKGPRSSLGVLVYVERKTGKRYLQAVFD